MNIVELTSKTDQLINQVIESYPVKDSQEIFRRDFGVKRADAAVEDASKLQQNLQEAEDENRLLKIGIIGRVKAGKSSLLNALLFKGKNVLPKAATPMTAALTIMTYAEKVKAELDFFTQQDIDSLAEKYRKVATFFEQTKQAHFDELSRNKRFGMDIHKTAQNRAESELREHPDYGSYDQYERIKDAKSRPDVNKGQTIEASSVQDLVGKLQDYIGAEGRYTPFTKSVKLYIPYEGLKGLEVIDTPGLNDPVASRGQRTEDELAKCDVVLVVSPYSQLLTIEDAGLLSRVTTKKGIQECFVVVSQIDSALISSESQNYANPEDLLTDTMADLRQHSDRTFAEIAKKNPEMSAIFNKFRENKLIYTSGMAESLYQQFDNQAEWDGDQRHTWNNLSEEYPIIFNNPENAKAVLKKLGNISEINAIIDDVRNRKEEIKKQATDRLTQAQQKALKEYLQESKKYLRIKVEDIQNADIDILKSQYKGLQSLKEDIAYYEKQAYKGLIQLIEQRLDDELINALEDALNKFTNPRSESKSESYEDEEWEEGFCGGLRRFFGGSGGKWVTVTKTRRFTEVYATPVKQDILRTIEILENALNKAKNQFFGLQTERSGWKYSKLPKELAQALDNAKNENPHIQYEIDRKVLSRAIDYVNSKVKIDRFELDTTLPSNISKSGYLRDSEGDRFVSDVADYMQNLRRSRTNEIRNKVNILVNELSQIDVAQEFVDYLENDAKDLIASIENKEETVTSLKNSLEQITKLESTLGAN